MSDLIERAELINKNMVQAKEIERLTEEQRAYRCLAKELMAEKGAVIERLNDSNDALIEIGHRQAGEIERLTAELKQANADLALLRPVCSASSGGMVDGVMCPACKGAGFVQEGK